MKFKASLLFVSACILCGCESYQTSADLQRELQGQLQTVVIEDGISIQEANTIAQSYFLHFGPGCGVAAGVIDGGKFWVANTFVGYAGIQTPEPIRIDKQTGRITWSNGPTVENPKTIFLITRSSKN
jgi:hypothetical protein